MIDLVVWADKDLQGKIRLERLPKCKYADENPIFGLLRSIGEEIQFMFKKKLVVGYHTGYDEAPYFYLAERRIVWLLGFVPWPKYFNIVTILGCKDVSFKNRNISCIIFWSETKQLVGEKLEEYANAVNASGFDVSDES